MEWGKLADGSYLFFEGDSEVARFKNADIMASRLAEVLHHILSVEEFRKSQPTPDPKTDVVLRPLVS